VQLRGRANFGRIRWPVYLLYRVPISPSTPFFFARIPPYSLSIVSIVAACLLTILLSPPPSDMASRYVRTPQLCVLSNRSPDTTRTSPSARVAPHSSPITRHGLPRSPLAAAALEVGTAIDTGPIQALPKAPPLHSRPTQTTARSLRPTNSSAQPHRTLGASIVMRYFRSSRVKTTSRSRASWARSGS
jgi:hypothetical protein